MHLRGFGSSGHQIKEIKTQVKRQQKLKHTWNKKLKRVQIFFECTVVGVNNAVKV